MPTKADRSRSGSRLRRRLDGEKFGYLTVLRYAGQHRIESKTSGKVRWLNLWLCRCERDGNEVSVREHHLLEGKTTSCGCMRGVRIGYKGKVVLPGQMGLSFKRQAEWERWRADRRAGCRVLWEGWYNLLVGMIATKAVPHSVLRSRLGWGAVKFKELLDPRAPKVPGAEDAHRLAVELYLLGPDRLMFEEAAKVAREAVQAYEDGKEWAVKRVEEARVD